MSKGTSELKAWRAKQRPPMAQRKLAAALDIDPSILSKIENGHWKPGRALALKIQSITKVKSASWDLDDEGDSKAA